MQAPDGCAGGAEGHGGDQDGAGHPSGAGVVTGAGEGGACARVVRCVVQMPPGPWTCGHSGLVV